MPKVFAAMYARTRPPRRERPEPTLTAFSNQNGILNKMKNNAIAATSVPSADSVEPNRFTPPDRIVRTAVISTRACAT
ncbi:hypothetical protein ACXIZN_24585 [Amycolatopsis sp. TRM77291]